MARTTKKPAPTPVEAYEMHGEYTRATLPTGEYSGINPEDLVGKPTPTVSYPLGGKTNLEEEFAARDPDLDPQYIWRGKKPNDINELQTAAPYIYQQEKIFPRMLIEEMKRQTAIRRNAADAQLMLGEGLEGFDPNAKPSFYNHEEGWKNRMILGDSLQVMASLAENERLRGKVQMIYMDPPYGIKFNSNWQPSTKSTNVKDGAASDITREPEMVKAFRDTWHDGIHSYLGYLRDRLTVARDLLTETGSIFVQISDENVHKVRIVLDEVFGSDNFVSQIVYKKSGGLGTDGLKSVADYILWYARNITNIRVKKYIRPKVQGEGTTTGERYNEAYDALSGRYRPLLKEERLDSRLIPETVRTYRFDNLASSGYTTSCIFQFYFEGKLYSAGGGKSWKTNLMGMTRLLKARRIGCTGKSLQYRRFMDDYACYEGNNIWDDCATRTDKQYIVETASGAVARCIQMTSDPGDLVLDPTCGSGTTAYVAEQWGRRWITIDTSRVALALARKRLMTAKFPYYLLADSEAGLRKEMDITGKPIVRPVYGKISQGFVYERVPHITLKAIANNSEIDTIWEKYEAQSKSLRDSIAQEIGKSEKGIALEEWEVPFEAPAGWSDEAKKLQAEFMEMKRKRQSEIDASIARSADTEYLYDKPYEDRKRVRVAGPFTVESIAPVRALVTEADGSLTDPALKLAHDVDYGNGANYVTRMIRTLRKNGVKQARKADKIDFTSVEPYAGGRYIAAEAWGVAPENGKAKRYAVAFGPEFGSVTRLDMKNASREAMEGEFDVLLYCAFNYEAYVEEGSDTQMGRLKVLQARMNSDLHMSTDLKDTGSGNPFVIFGEPDFTVAHTEDDLFTVTIRGVNVYDPKTNTVRDDDADAIDCWMLDTDYTGEAFFARQVYFPGGTDVYRAIKQFLKKDIDEEEWESVAQTTSRPFPRPRSGQIAVKVINHFGDEVMKVFRIE